MKIKIPKKLQVISKNKKLISVIVIVLAVIALIAGLVIFLSLRARKEAQKEQEALLQEALLKEKEAEAPEALPPVFLSPAEILTREAEISGESIESLLPTKQEVQKPRKRTDVSRYYRKLDSESLLELLKDALEKDDEGMLNQALKGLEHRGADIVNILKEEILNNFSKPQVRRNAVWGLFYSGRQEALPVIKAVIKADPSEEVRLAAIFVLDSITGSDEADFFEEVSRNDPSLKVRLKAEEYLRLMNINQ